MCWVGSSGTYGPAKRERAGTHGVKELLALPVGFAHAQPVNVYAQLECKPCLPSGGRLLPFDLALVNRGLGPRTYLYICMRVGALAAPSGMQGGIHSMDSLALVPAILAWIAESVCQQATER